MANSGSGDGGASTGAIRAGAAFVELIAKDADLLTSIDHAEGELHHFAEHTARIGQRVRANLKAGTSDLLAGGDVGAIQAAGKRIGEQVAVGMASGLAGRATLTQLAVQGAFGAAGTAATILARPFPQLRNATLQVADAVATLGVGLSALDQNFGRTGTSARLVESGIRKLADAVGGDVGRRILGLAEHSELATRALQAFGIALGKKPTSMLSVVIDQFRSRLPEAGVLLTALGKAAVPAGDMLEQLGKRIGGPVGEALVKLGGHSRQAASWLDLLGRSAFGLDMILSAQKWVAGIPTMLRNAFAIGGRWARSAMEAVLAGVATLFDNRLYRAIRRVGDGFQWLGTRAAVAGGAIATAGLAAFHATDYLATMASDRAVGLYNLNLASGESVENLSRLAFAGEQVGITFETMSGAVTAWSDRVSRAADTQDALFQALGLDARRLLGMGVFEQLAEVNAALSTHAPQHRSRALTELGLQSLLPLLGDGTRRFHELTSAADEFGAVMGADAVQSLNEFNRLWNLLFMSVKYMAIDFGTAMYGDLETTRHHIQLLRSGIGLVRGFLAEFRQYAMPAMNISIAVGLAGAALAGFGVVSTVVGMGIGSLVTIMQGLTGAALVLAGGPFFVLVRVFTTLLGPARLLTGALTFILGPMGLLRTAGLAVVGVFTGSLAIVRGVGVGIVGLAGGARLLFSPMMLLVRVFTVFPVLLRMSITYLRSLITVTALYRVVTMGLSGTMHLLQAAIGMALNPSAMVGRGLILGAILLYRYRDQVKDVLGSIGALFKSGFESIVKTAKEAFGSIMQAVNAGDFSLAWQIALAAIELEWAKFLDYFGPSVRDAKAIWVGTLEGLRDVWDWVTDQIKKALDWLLGEEESTTKKSEINWRRFLSNLVDGWYYAIWKIQSRLSQFQTDFSKGLNVIAYHLGIVTKEEGAGINDTLNQMESESQADLQRNWFDEMAKRNQERDKQAQVQQENLKDAQKNFDDLRERAARLQQAHEHANREQAARISANIGGRIRGLTLASGDASLFRQALGVGESTAQRQLKAAETTAGNTGKTNKILEKIGRNHKEQVFE